MHSASQLWELYEEWKRLTITEGAAITASNWSEVRRCQTNKKQLQPRIIQLTEICKKECTTPAEIEQIDSRVRSYVNDLIQLESRNNQVLQDRLQLLAQERVEMDRTASRLRQIHKTYVPPPQAVWDSYS